MPKRQPYTLRQIEWLHEQYSRYNKLYWDNQLPNAVRILVVPAGRRGYSIDCRYRSTRPTYMEQGMTTSAVDDAGNLLMIPIVELNERIMDYPPFACSVLMHEMIHVAGVQGHGKAFKAEAARIAKLGALLDLIT